MNILPFLFVSTVGQRGGAQVGEHWPDVMALLRFLGSLQLVANTSSVLGSDSAALFVLQDNNLIENFHWTIPGGSIFQILL